MQIAVTEAQTKFLQELVRSGRYASLADAVAGALKLLDEALATERRFDPIGAHVAARLQLGDGRPNELRRASDRVNRHGREALQPQQTRKL